MPAITPPTAAEIASWGIIELGPRKGEEPVETVEVDNNTCARVFLVNWADRFKFARWLIGYSTIWDDGGTLKLSRLMPQAHVVADPFGEGEDADPIHWPFTKVTEMRGHQWASETAGTTYNTPGAPASGVATAGLPRQAYTKCRVSVLAEQVPFELLDDEATDSDEKRRYVEYPCENSDPSGEYLQLPGAALVRVAEPGSPQVGSALDAKLIPQNIGKIVPQEVFRVRWHRLPFAVWDAGSPLYQRIFGGDEGGGPYFGSVNKNTGFFGRPGGTVLMTGVKPYRSKSPTGIGFELMLEFEFTYKPSGWNWVYGFLVGDAAAALAANGWYHASADGTFRYAPDLVAGASIYDGNDLNNLFVVGALSP